MIISRKLDAPPLRQSVAARLQFVWQMLRVTLRPLAVRVATRLFTIRTADPFLARQGTLLSALLLGLSVVTAASLLLPIGPLTWGSLAASTVGLLALYALARRGILLYASGGLIGALLALVPLLALDAPTPSLAHLQTQFLLALAIGLTGVFLTPRCVIAVVLLAGLETTALYSLLPSFAWDTPPIPGFLTVWVLYGVTGLLAVLVAILRHQQQTALANLHQALHAQQQRQASLLVQLLTTSEQEHIRMARALHDGPVQDLSTLLLTLESGRRALQAGSPTTAMNDLQAMRSGIQEVLTRLRGLMQEIEPTELEIYGLRPALYFLAHREPTLRVLISSSLTDRLDPMLELVIFRLVQESLVNIRKHAQAEHAWIWLEQQDDQVVLLVRDDGCGFDVAQCHEVALRTGHRGLASLYERAAAIGGQLTIDSTPEKGTVLRFTVTHPVQSATLTGPCADGLRKETPQ